MACGRSGSVGDFGRGGWLPRGGRLRVRMSVGEGVRLGQGGGSHRGRRGRDRDDGRAGLDASVVAIEVVGIGDAGEEIGGRGVGGGGIGSDYLQVEGGMGREVGLGGSVEGEGISQGQGGIVRVVVGLLVVVVAEQRVVDLVAVLLLVVVLAWGKELRIRSHICIGPGR